MYTGIALNSRRIASGGSYDVFSMVLFIQEYIFIGTGLWYLPANWYNNSVPPASFPAGAAIQVNPAGNTDAILNVPQTILTGGKLTIMPGKSLIIPGNLD